MIFVGPGTTLLIITKYAVFAEVLIFSNISGFMMVNWAIEWTENLNIYCILFEPKFKTFKDFSNTVFLIGDYLWSKF